MPGLKGTAIGNGKRVVPAGPVVNPYLAVLLGVAAVASSAIFARLAAAPPMIIAFYRLGITVLILSSFVLAGRDSNFGRLERRDMVLACCSGAMLALHFTVWIASLNYTSVASSTVLVTMHPLFVITGGYLLWGETIKPPGLAGAAMAIAGSILVGISDFQAGGRAFYGDVLAFSGAIFMAGYVLVGRGLRKRLSLLPYVLLVYGAAALILLFGALGAGDPFWPYPATTWLWFAALAVLPTILGHTVFNWALKYVKAAVVSMSILGEPVGATVLAYFIFDEVPTLLRAAGGIIIITGLAVFIYTAGKEGEA